MYNVYRELGGFAEDEDVLDGTVETFNAFNFCLAEDYYAAMLEEDFEAIGEICVCTFENIMYWLNYDGDISRTSKEEIEKIKTGLFLTCKNRTFIDAIIENKNTVLAWVYIMLGNKDIRLYTLYTMYDDTPIFAFRRMGDMTKNKEEYILFIKSYFNELEKEYEKISDREEKLNFLRKIKSNFNLEICPKQYGQITLNMREYKFVKELKLIED